MDILLDPNIAYILMMTSLMLTLLAIITPGTGILEAGALTCLVLAGYYVYNRGINIWAAGIMLAGIIPFLYTFRTKKLRWLVLLLCIAMVAGGSIFLFLDQRGIPVINPFLAVTVSALYAGFVWLAVDRALTAFQRHPAHDPALLVGQTGEARTDIHTEGSAQVNGELWSARSDQPIPAGSAIRVVRREGFFLIVEKQ